MLLDGPRRQKNAHVRAMPCRATPHAQPTGPSRPTTGPALRARQEATTRSDSRCARASELPSKARLDAHGAQAPLGGGQEEEEEEEEEEPVGEAGSWQWRCEGPASNAILSGRSSSGAIGLAAASIQQAGRQTRRGGSKKLRSTREAGRSSERCAAPLFGDSDGCGLQRVWLATGTQGAPLGCGRGPRRSSPPRPEEGGPTRAASCSPGPDGADRKPHPGVTVPFEVAGSWPPLDERVAPPLHQSPLLLRIIPPPPLPSRRRRRRRKRREGQGEPRDAQCLVPAKS
ncbi:unnamed protein product [Prorocentrum cordatum]|uniref:Uncharacterized protein n=1 Tax=Prorocentrum cordatum TaxID=2364126 RepID=A0ABN9VD70_9DINO|nr:unnamed protein product [Polarella glacialis]